MATKHGGRLPGSDGGEENDDERGAEDDSEVHREFGREDFGESEMSSQLQLSLLLLRITHHHPRHRLL